MEGEEFLPNWFLIVPHQIQQNHISVKLCLLPCDFHYTNHFISGLWKFLLKARIQVPCLGFWYSPTSRKSLKQLCNKEITACNVFSTKSWEHTQLCSSQKKKAQRCSLNMLNNSCSVLLVVNIHWLTFKSPGWPREIFLKIMSPNSLR